MFREPDTKGNVSSPNDTTATFEPEDVVVNDLDGSTRHYATSNTVHDTTCIREQDHEPSLHSHQEAHHPEIDNQEESRAPPPHSSRKESGQVISYRKQNTGPQGTSRQSTTDPPSHPQSAFGVSTAHRLLASFLNSRQNLVIQPIDMSTNEGHIRIIQFMQDFFQWLADRPESDKGAVVREGLGLDMGNTSSVVFPGLAGFTTLVLSQRSNTIPRRVNQPLGSIFRVGDLF
jgi:hypothetical protein